VTFDPPHAITLSSMKRTHFLGLSTAAAATAATAAFLLRSRGIRKQMADSDPRDSGERRDRRSTDLVGSAARHGRGVDAALLRRIEEALEAALGAESALLTVFAEDGGVVVRGEVATLDRISRASEALAPFEEEVEITNLIRLGVTTVRRASAT